MTIAILIALAAVCGACLALEAREERGNGRGLGED